MRAESLRRMAEEMAALKRSAVTLGAKEFFAKREQECRDEADEQERCSPERPWPATADRLRRLISSAVERFAPGLHRCSHPDVHADARCVAIHARKMDYARNNRLRFIR